MRKKSEIPAKKIAECIIDGKANKEIAIVINKKKKTVDDYIHRLFQIHHCKNRTQLAMKILNLVV